MPFTKSSAMWQLSFPMSEERAKALSKDNARLKAEILKRCACWHKPVPELLESTPLDCFSGYPVYDREVRVYEERNDEPIRFVSLRFQLRPGSNAIDATPFATRFDRCSCFSRRSSAIELSRPSRAA